jgi:hypothetical protein
MIPIPQNDENENEDEKLITPLKNGKGPIPKNIFIFKCFGFIAILIILRISFSVDKNNSFDPIEKIKENNNVNNNKSNLSIIINSFNEKNDLISLINKILTKNIENSEIILTTNYFFNYSLLENQEKEFLQKNISSKFIEYNENTNIVKILLDSASRSNGDYILFINPEELLSFNILNNYKKITKDNIDIIQYDLNYDRIEDNKVIYQPQIFESLFFSHDSIKFNHFHIYGKLYKKEILLNSIKNLDELYLSQSDKYFNEMLIVTLVFKQANTFIKLRQNESCDRNKCQSKLFYNYDYRDKKVLKDTILFLRFLLEYTGKDKVQEKRMAAKIFYDLLIQKKIKSFYNSELLQLIIDTINLYLNCDLINDMDKNEIMNYRKSIKK